MELQIQYINQTVLWLFFFSSFNVTIKLNIQNSWLLHKEGKRSNCHIDLRVVLVKIPMTLAERLFCIWITNAKWNKISKY